MNSFFSFSFMSSEVIGKDQICFKLQFSTGNTGADCPGKQRIFFKRHADPLRRSDRLADSKYITPQIVEYPYLSAGGQDFRSIFECFEDNHAFFTVKFFHKRTVHFLTDPDRLSRCFAYSCAADGNSGVFLRRNGEFIAAVPVNDFQNKRRS